MGAKPEPAGWKRRERLSAGIYAAFSQQEQRLDSHRKFGPHQRTANRRNSLAAEFHRTLFYPRESLYRRIRPRSRPSSASFNRGGSAADLVRSAGSSAAGLR